MSHDQNPDALPPDDRENEPRYKATRESSWAGWLFGGLLVLVIFAFLMPTINHRTYPAPRSAHDEQLAKQQLVERQIAEVEAALAAEQAAIAAAR